MLYNFQKGLELGFRPTGGGEAMAAYATDEAVKMGYGYTSLMAVAIIEAIPIFIVFMIFREHIMKGVRLRGFK